MDRRRLARLLLRAPLALAARGAWHAHRLGMTRSPMPLADFEAYRRPRIAPGEIAPDRIFVVNSVPKSGTVWMIEMLADLLGLDPGRRFVLSHVADIHEDLARHPVHSAVALVRDLRDVVVSWHHETLRADRAAGFAAARYPTVEAFYFEHLVGLLRLSPRFAHSRLKDWLDFVTGSGLPLVRYEDLLADSAAVLGKVVRFWKIDVAEAAIARTAAAHGFGASPAAVSSGLIAPPLADGHRRRGVAGAWRDELPETVRLDIAERFGGFQSRLGYA
jgi:hypothetical protein